MRVLAHGEAVHVPADMSLKELVRLWKLRWDHFEGRTWRGFHHHATLCMVAHGFLALRRALFPRRRTRWTLPEVRRRLQHLLMRRIGHCPLCLRLLGPRAPPRGPSRI